MDKKYVWIPNIKIPTKPLNSEKYFAPLKPNDVLSKTGNGIPCFWEGLPIKLTCFIGKGVFQQSFSLDKIIQVTSLVQGFVLKLIFLWVVSQNHKHQKEKPIKKYFLKK